MRPVSSARWQFDDLSGLGVELLAVAELLPQPGTDHEPVRAGVTVAGLARIAGAISYSHMRQPVAAHGETGWLTTRDLHAFRWP